jgi:hypothetical protein
VAEANIDHIVLRAARGARTAGQFLVRARRLRRGGVLALRRCLLGAGFWVGAIDVERSGGSAALLQALAEAFAFPGYFGRNWDAAVDCLSDLSWIEAERYACLLVGSAALRAADRQAFRTFLEVCRVVAQRFKEQGRPHAFTLVLF